MSRARVSPGLGLAPALLLGLGSPFPLSVCSLGLYSVADFPPAGGPVWHWPPPHVCVGGACLSGRRLRRLPPVLLAAAACAAAVQCSPELALASRHVLCPMRLVRCRHPHLWRGCPRHSSGVPLPLAVAPRGMPRQPHLHVLVTGGVQLIAEPHVRLRCIALGGGRWRACVASSFLTGPLTTGWATRCASCWGAVPLGLVRRGGF
jgi:hypothetical protein